MVAEAAPDIGETLRGGHVELTDKRQGRMLAKDGIVPAAATPTGSSQPAQAHGPAPATPRTVAAAAAPVATPPAR